MNFDKITGLILITQSGHSYAHAMIANLLWHVQYYFLIPSSLLYKGATKKKKKGYNKMEVDDEP